MLHIADEHLVVHFGEGLDELLAAALRLLEKGIRDGPLLWRLIAVLGEEGSGHIHQANDALEGILNADWRLDGHGPGAQPFLDHLHRAPEVGTDAVHLVDEADARDMVAVSLAPHGLRLALHPGDGVEHNNASVQDTEAAFHFHGEVHVAGGIYDVDDVILPVGGGGGGGDGDSALSLLGHPVHDSGAGIHVTNLVGAPRVEEDALGDRSLAGIDVSDDPDIP